jgi:hypothetical protein
MGENTKPFDNASKRLLMVGSQDLLDWLSPGSQFVGQFSEQFHSAEIETDAMIETRCNGLCEIVHFEFQSGPDTDMAQRLLEYYIQAYRRYRCPVRSFVLYLRKSGALPASPLIRTYSDGKEFLRFHFQVVPLCLEEVVGKVGAAQSAEAVTDILLSWLPDDDAEEELIRRLRVWLLQLPGYTTPDHLLMHSFALPLASLRYSPFERLGQAVKIRDIVAINGPGFGFLLRAAHLTVDGNADTLAVGEKFFFHPRQIGPAYLDHLTVFAAFNQRFCFYTYSKGHRSDEAQVIGEAANEEQRGNRTAQRGKTLVNSNPQHQYRNTNHSYDSDGALERAKSRSLKCLFLDHG